MTAYIFKFDKEGNETATPYQPQSKETPQESSSSVPVYRFKFDKDGNETATLIQSPKTPSQPKTSKPPGRDYADTSAAQLADQALYYGKDFAKQAGKGYATGALGAYGDLLGLITPESDDFLPGEKARRGLEFQALENIEKGNPSIWDFFLLDEDDMIAPRFTRPSTSKDVLGLLNDFNLNPGEPETLAGRYGNRAGRLAGAGAAFGILNPLPSLFPAAVGQVAEELGAPEWAQALVELGAYVRGHKGASGLKAKAPETQELLNHLEQLGYSPQSRKLALEAFEAKPSTVQRARMTPEAERAFASAEETAEGAIQRSLEERFPELKEGLSEMEQQASNVYQEAQAQAKNLKVRNPERFFDEGIKAMDEVSNTLAMTPEQRQVYNLLEQALVESLNDPSADRFVNFYKGLNSLGKWLDPGQRERIFGRMKTAIYDTFRKEGPEGRKLAETFEKANKDWANFTKASDLTEILQRVRTEDGLNFKALYNLTKSVAGFERISKIAGPKVAQSLRSIGKAGSQIKDLEKAIANVSKSFSVSDAGLLKGFFDVFTHGDFRTLMLALGSKVGKRKLSQMMTKSLTDPNYLKIAERIVQGTKQNAPRIVLEAIRDYSKELD